MKRIFLLVTGIVLIGGIASAQINVGGGASAILGTELYLYTYSGEQEEYCDLFSGGINAHIDVGNPLAFFLDASVAFALKGNETYYVDGEYVPPDLPFTVNNFTENLVLSGLVGAGVNLPLGAFDLFAGAGGHIYMYTYNYVPEIGPTVYNDMLSLGVGAMANAVFPMGGYSLYAGGTVAYDFYHVTAPHLDAVEAYDPQAALGILVGTVSVGALIEF